MGKEKVSLRDLQTMKDDGRKIVGVVAWDYQIAKIVDRAGVDQRLHQQLSADATAGFIKCLGGDGQPSVAGESDQAIAQVAAL